MLVNDAAISLGIPWIYAAAVGSYGLTMTIRPGVTACLACLLEGEDGARIAGAEATCDTAGILNAAVGVVASIEAAEAVKIAGREARGAAWPTDLLRCLEREIPIGPCGARIRIAGRACAVSLLSWTARHSRISPCAGGIRCRFTNAAGS